MLETPWAALIHAPCGSVALGLWMWPPRGIDGRGCHGAGRPRGLSWGHGWQRCLRSTGEGQGARQVLRAAWPFPVSHAGLAAAQG